MTGLQEPGLMAIQVNSLRYKWYLIGILFCAVAVNYADRTAISSVFPLLKKDLRMSDVAIGGVGSAFLWTYALFSPLAGYLGDRFSRSSLITWSLVAWSLVTAATGLVSTSRQLLAMRVVLGIAECLYIPASIALIADHHPAHSRAKAMAIHLSGLYAGMVAGGTLAGYLADRYSWRSSFLVLGGIGLGMGLVCHFYLIENPNRKAPLGETMSHQGVSLPIWTIILELLGIPSYLVLLGEAMLISIGAWIFITWLPLYFKETFDLSLAKAGFYGTFVIQTAAVLGILGGGYPSDQVARRSVSYRMLLQAICYLIEVPFLLSFLWLNRLTSIAVSIFAFSFIQALGASNEQPLICDLLRPNLRSTAIGIMNMMNCLVGGLGVLTAGYLKRGFGLSGVFAGVAIVVLTAGTLLLIGYLFFLSKDLQRYAASIVHVNAHETARH
jgi:predicted MFS family arabinose efflux permease